MHDKTIKLLRMIYGIALSVMIGISGLLLMAACIQIYQSGGEQIYTPQKVAAAFAPIATPIYITLAMIAGSFLLVALLPAAKKHQKVEKQYAFMLRNAYKKADMQLCDSDLLIKIDKEQTRRRLALIASLTLWAMGGIAFLPYACNSANYAQELHLATDSIVGIIYLLIPCSLIPTAGSIFAAYYCRASIRRELELVKLVPKSSTPKSPVSESDKNILYVRLAIFAVAFVMIVGGFVAGGTADVLAKAVAICTECVGLG